MSNGLNISPDGVFYLILLGTLVNHLDTGEILVGKAKSDLCERQ